MDGDGPGQPGELGLKSLPVLPICGSLLPKPGIDGIDDDNLPTPISSNFNLSSSIDLRNHPPSPAISALIFGRAVPAAFLSSQPPRSAPTADLLCPTYFPLSAA
jgi:hypothetical protein